MENSFVFTSFESSFVLHKANNIGGELQKWQRARFCYVSEWNNQGKIRGRGKADMNLDEHAK